jgi:hypothetical protein
MTTSPLLAALIFLIVPPLPGQGVDQIWLDRPLSSWNESVKNLPQPPKAEESVKAFAARCKLEVRRSSPAERALADAGWLPYLHVDRQLVQGDIEIVAGMTGVDGMCRPTGFNVFVFVGGQFAGTLSPVPMSSREDGSIGAVRLGPDGAIAAEFARYGEKDALCCPSGRVGIRYRVERGSRPVVVPVSTQILR